MKAKELANILFKNPYLEVVILEGQKHNDNIPALRITRVDKLLNDDGDEFISITTTPNPETVLAITDEF